MIYRLAAKRYRYGLIEWQCLLPHFECTTQTDGRFHKYMKNNIQTKKKCVRFKICYLTCVSISIFWFSDRDETNGFFHLWNGIQKSTYEYKKKSHYFANNWSTSYFLALPFVCVCVFRRSRWFSFSPSN